MEHERLLGDSSVMKPRRTGLWAVLLCALLLCAAAALAGGARAKEPPKPKTRPGAVVAVRGGTLERREGTAWRGLAAGKAVSFGDRLRTGKGALAVVELPDVGRFVIGPGSEVELGRDPRDFTASATRGAVWLQTALPEGNRAALSTPLAIAGVRGTAFSMVFGEGEKAVCACTCSGEVAVTTPDGGSLNVPKGEYVAIAAGAAPPASAEPSAPVLAKAGTVFDFCLSCHVAGGKGELKPDWR